MNKTLLIIRIAFLLLCILGGYLIWYANQDWESYLWVCLLVSGLLGVLTILVDILLKGFSLRGLTAVTFGLGMGVLVAYLISSSPLFEQGEPEILHMTRLGLFVVCMYLGTVLALRGKDDFSLVIPYMRFVPHNVEVPLVVVDSSALIDGRIAPICESRFFSSGLVVPQFVIDELAAMADSPDPARKVKGRKGIATLNHLRSLSYIDLRVHETGKVGAESMDDRIIYIAETLKAKILTLDYNLAQLAEFRGITWLNLVMLTKALNPELTVGSRIEVDLVKNGRDAHQAVGYLPDGSMVVVNHAAHLIGRSVEVEVQSVLPSAGGRMVFSQLVEY